jgi:Sulfotransferase domain
VAGLPNLIVIGAMKCGTTALHRILDTHPDIAMAPEKELNFFFGPATQPPTWHAGNWHRGTDWYAGRFDARARVRGEASPGYTSPHHPEVAARMATVVPEARLVYLVRDPLARAVSQYHHHVRDGTEHRPIVAALRDPASQYLSRSCYHARLEPFLAHYHPDRITAVAQEALRADPRRALGPLLRQLDVDPDGLPLLRGSAGRSPVSTEVDLDPGEQAELRLLFTEDLRRLHELTGIRVGRPD